MAKSKNKRLTNDDLRSSPHIVYWNILYDIAKASAKKQDIGHLVNLLFSMLAHAHDAKFTSEWDRIRSWETSLRESRNRVNVRQVRLYELGAITRLMYRRGMLEEARLVDTINV